jgi:chemotaxis signal transduction protein/chemotaxis regulatin CheY-phosphate phosphatase CheZ
MIAQKASGQTHHLVSFKLGEEEFALDIHHVQEINRPTQVTRIPNTDSWLCGVINLRGKVIPVVDLGEKFGLPRREATKDSRIMVVGLKDSGRVGLMVDSVSEVLHLPEETLESPPPMIKGISAEFIRAIGKMQDRLILLLNLSSLFDETQISQLTSSVPPINDPPPSTAGTTPQHAESELQEVLDAAKAMAEGNFRKEVQHDLYGQVGEIAKYINSTLKKLQHLEPNIKITSEKIPQASLQLSEITKTTEEATHRVMSLAEQVMENHDLMVSRLGQLESEVSEVEGGRAPMKELRRIVAEDQEALMEVMTALSFQDITGQKIKKIITMVEEIEKRILQLLVTFGISQTDSGKKEEVLREVMATQDIKQDRVNDILKDFGF